MVLSARDRESKNYETPLQHPLATGHLHLYDFAENIIV